MLTTRAREMAGWKCINPLDREAATHLRPARRHSPAIDLAVAPRHLQRETECPGLPRRHGMLWTTIGWSHEPCSPNERLLWTRLSVFRSAPDTATVQAVCIMEPLSCGDVRTALTGLAEQSVISCREDAWAMLDTRREYVDDPVARNVHIGGRGLLLVPPYFNLGAPVALPRHRTATRPHVLGSSPRFPRPPPRALNSVLWTISRRVRPWTRGGTFGDAALAPHRCRRGNFSTIPNVYTGES